MQINDGKCGTEKDRNHSIPRLFSSLNFEVNSLTNNQGQRHGILKICIWATKTARPLVKCHKDRATSTRPILPLHGFVLIPAAVISSNSCLFTEHQVIEVYSAGTRLWVGTFRIEKSCKSFQLHSLPRMFTNTLRPTSLSHSMMIHWRRCTGRLMVGLSHPNP